MVVISNFILIEFDRTPPLINVYAPPYTTNHLVNEITIESNENLADFQEIYVIDEFNNRYDYTFEKVKGNQFLGLLKFSNLHPGIVTIYVKMQDEVGNYSNIISKAIIIKESLTVLSLDVSHSERKMNDKSSSMKTGASDKVQNIKVDIKQRKVLVNNG